MSTDEPLSRVKLDDALISRLRTVLGDDNGDAFALLWAEYLHLRMCFNDLKNGFGGDDPPMIQVWAISQQFADRYWTLLLEETVLSVCRLTDKRRVSGKKTTSISVLPEWFAAEPGVKNEVEQLVNTAKTAAEVLRIWRNTQLAHTAEKRERPPVTGRRNRSRRGRDTRGAGIRVAPTVILRTRAAAPDASDRRPRRAPRSHARDHDNGRGVAVRSGRPRRQRRYSRRRRRHEAPYWRGRNEGHRPQTGIGSHSRIPGGRAGSPQNNRQNRSRARRQPVTPRRAGITRRRSSIPTPRGVGRGGGLTGLPPQSGPVTADTPLSAGPRWTVRLAARRARHAVRPKASACRSSRLARGRRHRRTRSVARPGGFGRRTR